MINLACHVWITKNFSPTRIPSTVATMKIARKWESDRAELRIHLGLAIVWVAVLLIANFTFVIPDIINVVALVLLVGFFNFFFIVGEIDRNNVVYWTGTILVGVAGREPIELQKSFTSRLPPSTGMYVDGVLIRSIELTEDYRIAVHAACEVVKDSKAGNSLVAKLGQQGWVANEKDQEYVQQQIRRYSLGRYD